MQYQEFESNVLEKVQEMNFPEGTTFVIKQVIKNNDTVLDGLVISEPDEKVSPTIYLNQFFQNGNSVDEAVDRIHQVYFQNRGREVFNVNSFLDYEKARENITMKLINREKNAKLLKDAPFVPFLDLAVVFTFRAQENGVIVIKNEHAEMWGVTAEELLQEAKKNSKRILPAEFMSMSELIPIPVSDDIGMKVLTNSERVYGAATILYEGVLKECAKQKSFISFLRVFMK